MKANIVMDRSSFGWYNIAHVAAIFTESMDPTFDTPGDSLPKGQIYGTRAKYIHTVGSIAEVKWESVGNHPYTGLFKGADNGFARLSFAKEPSPKSLNTAPGMGIKFLRDGIDSGNFVAMYSVDGHDSWNFFKDDFTNHIPAAGPALQPLAKKFSSSTKWVQQTSLSDFATYGGDGKKEANPVFPYSLRFHNDNSHHFADEYHGTFTDDFAKITVGETLYEVYAMDQPKELGGTETLIGKMITTSAFTTSKWADEHFYIRHQRMDVDLALKPEWAQYTP